MIGVRLIPYALLLLCASLFVSFSADKVLAQEEPDCAEPSTQRDMNACADIDYDKADRELNSEYKKVRKVLSDRDADADESGKGAVEALVAAQRAWVAYRDANCELAGFQARGGTMEPMLVSSCLADMSRKRAADLSELSEGF